MRKIDGPIPSGSTVNILFLSRLFYPHIGGVEKHVMEISKLLIKDGHKITVVTEKHEGNLREKEDINGIDVYRIDVDENAWFKKFKIWKWLWGNSRLFKNADIIHCHDVFFWYLPFRFLFPFKKVYTTFHGYESFPLKFKDILMHKISEKLSRGNICIGDFIKKWYGTKADYISYGGVSIVKNSKFPPSPRLRRASKIQNSKSAVFIGRLDEQTGIKTYAEAVKLIRKKIPNFDFKIIGDGKFKKALEKDFEVLGFINNPEKYFQEYNFAFVSRYLSILEAMAAKRLVFAVYDNPLKEDYLRKTPFSKFIIVSNNPSELVSEISFYTKNLKAKEKIIKKAYSWAKNQSWENLGQIYLKLWGKTNNQHSY